MRDVNTLCGIKTGGIGCGNKDQYAKVYSHDFHTSISQMAER